MHRLIGTSLRMYIIMYSTSRKGSNLRFSNLKG